MIEIKIADALCLDKAHLKALADFFNAMADTRPPAPLTGTGIYPFEMEVGTPTVLDTPSAEAEPQAPIPPALKVPPIPMPELDANGDAWDALEHSRTKRKDKNGVWLRLKKTPTPLPLPTEPVVDHAVPPPPATAEATFNDVMFFVTDSLQKERIQPERVEKILKSHGLINLPALLQEPEKVDAVLKSFKQVVNNEE